MKVRFKYQESLIGNVTLPYPSKGVGLWAQIALRLSFVLQLEIISQLAEYRVTILGRLR